MKHEDETDYRDLLQAAVEDPSILANLDPTLAVEAAQLRQRVERAESELATERAQRGRWAKTLEGALLERDRLESECERLRGLVEGAYREGATDAWTVWSDQRTMFTAEMWADSKAKGLLEGPKDPVGAE